MLVDNDSVRHAAKFAAEQGTAASIAGVLCETCGAEMTLLGTLPPIRLRSAINVFRCTSCNHVTSREIQPASSRATQRRHA
jgi:hypothetical protein